MRSIPPKPHICICNRIGQTYQKRRPGISFYPAERLGRSRAELAAHMAIPELRLLSWEENSETLSTGQQSLWRVELRGYLNLEIRKALRTDNPELLSCFCDLVWRLG
jgi:hypothetical protein